MYPTVGVASEALAVELVMVAPEVDAVATLASETDVSTDAGADATIFARRTIHRREATLDMVNASERDWGFELSIYQQARDLLYCSVVSGRFAARQIDAFQVAFGGLAGGLSDCWEGC